MAWLVALGASLVLGSACLVEIRELQPIGNGAGGASTNTGSGASSSSGSGAGPTSGGGDMSGACPDGMIHITDPEFAPADFCIDATEVTQRQYAAFIAAVGNDVAQTDQPSQCATNMHLQQEGAYCPNNRQAPDEPVNCVDWCDAWAYCHHFGKRLCGSISNGGPLLSGDPGSNDEWEFACSNGLRQDFPYGTSPELCACYFPRSWEMEDPNGLCGNDSLKNFNAHNDVGTLPGCEGGFPGLYDMTGNIAEWTNRCPSDAPDAQCVTRGGFPFGSYTYDDCRQTARTWPRINNDLGAGVFDVGFRCCADSQ